MNHSRRGLVKLFVRGCRAQGGPLLAVAGLWGCGLTGLHAETDPSSSTQFLIQENARAAPPAQTAPATRGPSLHHSAPTFRRVLMQRASAPPRPRQALAATPVPPPVTVAVYGDRLGQALASGLQESGNNAVSVNAQTSEDAGLARPGFDAWLQGIRERLARPDRPAIAAVMLGSNDWHSLSDGSGSAEPDTPHWLDLYGKRVDTLAGVFRDAHVPLIWVGLPPVHSEETSAEFVRLNGIFRDHAARQGASYVDSWEAFSDDAGRYSPVGPDVEGQTVKLRKADGLAFTRAGARKLASFVEVDIKRLYKPATRSTTPELASINIEKTRDFDQALDIDVNAQIRREAGLLPEGASAAAGPARPAAGPIFPLTAPPLSPDGHLVSASATTPDTANAIQANLATRPFGGAAPITAQPGRTDDFSWPRP